MRDATARQRSLNLVRLVGAVTAVFGLLLVLLAPGASASTVDPVDTATSTSAPALADAADAAPAGSTPAETIPAESEEPTTSTTATPVDEVDVPDGTVSVTGGELVWGVRKSFITYILGPFPGGSVTVAGGAIDNFAADGTFRFPGLPGGSFDGATNATDASFAGSIHIKAHDEGLGPHLNIFIDNLRILRDDTGSWLVADILGVPFHGMSGGGVAPEEPIFYPDLKVASLDTDGVLPVPTPPNGLTWYDLDAVLTEEAVPAFGLYAAGETMAPVTYTLTFDEVPDVPIDPVGPVEPTVTLDKTVVVAGDTLTASAPEFTPGEQVEVWLHSTPTWVATATADASGFVTSTFVVPLDTPGGIHQIEMRGISSGESIRSADFTVIAAATTSPTTGTLPRTGADGRIAAVGAGVLVLGLVLVTVSRRSLNGRA